MPLSLVAAGCLAAGIALAVPDTAAATAETELSNASFYIEGASVRLAEDGRNGIRFHVFMSEEKFEALSDEETGVLIQPADLVDEDGLTADDAAGEGGARKVAFKASDWTQKDGMYTAAVYLYDIPASSYIRGIAARAYIAAAEGDPVTYEYTETVTRSLYSVATEALADTAADYTAEQKATLETYTDVPQEALVLDFTQDTVPVYDNVEYVQSYQGAADLMKISLSDTTPETYVNAQAWLPVFWQNYYGAYDSIVFELYVEGAENLTALTWAIENVVPGAPADDPDGFSNYDWVLTNRLVNGYNRIAFPIADFITYFKDFSRSFVFVPKLAQGSTATLYFDQICVANELAVSNGNLAAFTGDVEIKDDSAAVFGGKGVTDVARTVYGPDGAIVTLSGATIPDAGAGEQYTVVYSGADASGKTYTASYSFTVIGREQQNTLYVLDAASDLGIHHETYVSFLETYEGEQGVIKIASDGTWADDWLWLLRGGNIPFVREYYEGYDQLVLRVRADGGFTFRILAENQKEGDASIEYETVTVTDTGEWQDITLDFAYFYEHWDAFVGNFMIWSENNANGAALYIASVTVAKSVKVTDSYQGAAQSSDGSVALDDDAETVFAGCTDVQVSVRLADGSSVSVTEGAFATTGGEYTVVYTALNAQGVALRGSYALSVAYTENTLYAIDMASDLGNHHGTYVSFLKEYEGEQGVIKIASDGTWEDEWLWLLRGGNIPFEKEHYEGYDTLVLRVRADGGFTFRILAENQKEGDVQIRSSWNRERSRIRANGRISRLTLLTFTNIGMHSWATL